LLTTWQSARLLAPSDLDAQGEAKREVRYLEDWLSSSRLADLPLREPHEVAYGWLKASVEL